ncbi:MAG: LysR family transcriptional regulator [Burkholderiaceae bacterium]
MRFDLADLRLFLSIVDAGSITQGAVKAHLALASASERLRSIEQAAGVPLLERRRRGVVATEAGEALAHHARLMLRQQSVLQEELRDFASGALGTIHLYANTAALTEFLPSRLAPWLASRPRLSIDLKERTSAEIIRLIGAGLAQAGIVSDAVAAPGLLRQPVAADPLVAIVPRGHRLAGNTAIRFSALLDEAFVGLTPDSALQEHIDEHARDAGRPLRFRIRMKSFDGLCEMVASGVGIGIVPHSIARRHRRRHPCHALSLSDPWARRQLCVCLRRWSDLSASTRSLLIHLGARAGH